MTESSSKKSAAEPWVRYQDYVIKDGRFVGRFEDMYRDRCETGVE